MPIGERIKKIREHFGFNQTKMAGEIGVTTQSLHRYETNQRVPDVNLIKEILNFSKVDANWLILGTGEMFKATQQSEPISDMDKIKAAFPGIPIDGSFMEVYAALADKKISKIVRNLIVIHLELMENNEFADIFKKWVVAVNKQKVKFPYLFPNEQGEKINLNKEEKVLVEGSK